MSKRYYWLKLHKDFFKSKEIKKLRKVAGGDTFVIIYLKMSLLSLDANGLIEYEGIENTFAEELALELDEDPVNVNATLLFLQNMNMIEEKKEDEFSIPLVQNNTGSETPQASSMRKKRRLENQQDKKKDVTLLLECESNVTLEKEKREKRESKEKENKYKAAEYYSSYWNGFDELTKCRKVTDKIQSAINGLNSDGYDHAAIVMGINNYVTVLRNPGIYKHEFNFLNFLKQANGCRKFSDMKMPETYMVSNNNRPSKKPTITFAPRPAND